MTTGIENKVCLDLTGRPHFSMQGLFWTGFQYTYITNPLQVALVTGGNSGIGAATVILLKKQGAKVAVLDIAESALDASSNDLYIKCNVASQQEVEQSVTTVLEKFERLDILINCAGVMDGMGLSGRHHALLMLTRITEKIGDISNKIWVSSRTLKYTILFSHSPFRTYTHILVHTLTC